MNLIVSMGIPAKDVHKRQEGFRFNGAVIQVIDWSKKKVVKEISYMSPPEHLGNGLSMQFKGASIFNNKYFVVTNTEVLIYDLSGWSLEKVISHPSFNDLHGVMPAAECMYVCNTGLEMVQIVDYEGNIKKEINFASVPTYKRFNKKEDYRKVATTKPHEIHLNHAFLLGGEVWITRGNCRDAVRLYDQEQKLSFRHLFSADEMILCHDGIVKGDYIYFTTVNGHIIIIDADSRKVVKDIDVNKLNTTDRNIGWTRGLEIVGNKLFLGITKLRHSKFKEYIKWVLQKKEMAMLSSIIEVDFMNEKITDYYEMENYKGHALYTILQDIS